MLEPKQSLWRDFLAGIAVVCSAMLGAVVLYLATGLLLSVHLTS
jgi:threonine/homoserine/homoserine lactone efflux protein